MSVFIAKSLKGSIFSDEKTLKSLSCLDNKLFFIKILFIIRFIISVIIVIMVIINVLMIVYFRRRSRPYKKPDGIKEQGPQAQTSILKLYFLEEILRVQSI